MRRRTLSYFDAVRLLEPGNSALLTRLNSALGVGAAVASAATLSAVDFFALRDELIGWGRGVVGEIHRRSAGIDRFDRTQLLTAAHSIVVLSAYYDAFDETLTVIRDRALSREEQVAIATGDHPRNSYQDLLSQLVGSPSPMPSSSSRSKSC